MHYYFQINLRKEERGRKEEPDVDKLGEKNPKRKKKKTQNKQTQKSEKKSKYTTKQHTVTHILV